MKFHDQFQNLTLGSQNNCDSQRTSHNSLVIQIMENQSFWSEQCIPVRPPPAVSVYSYSSLWISLLFQLEFDGSSFHTLHSRYRLFLQCRIYFPILQIVWSHHSYRFLDWCDFTDCVVLYDPCECHLQGKRQVQGQQIPASLRSDRRTSTFPFAVDFTSSRPTDSSHRWFSACSSSSSHAGTIWPWWYVELQWSLNISLDGIQWYDLKPVCSPRGARLYIPLFEAHPIVSSQSLWIFIYAIITFILTLLSEVKYI